MSTTPPEAPEDPAERLDRHLSRACGYLGRAGMLIRETETGLNRLEEGTFGLKAARNELLAVNDAARMVEKTLREVEAAKP